MNTPTLEDFVYQFQTKTGWTAKQQVVCKVAKIYHRDGLLKFAELVDRPVEEFEEGYALKAAFQKKNRKRRGQKPIKKQKVTESAEEILKAVGNTDIYHREGRRTKNNELATHIRDFK